LEGFSNRIAMYKTSIIRNTNKNYNITAISFNFAADILMRPPVDISGLIMFSIVDIKQL